MKQILLYGYGVTGRSACDVLTERGWNIELLLDDEKERETVKPDLQAFSQHSGNIHVLSSANQIEWKHIEFVLKSPGIHLDRPVLLEAVQQGVEVISDIELAYRIYGGEKMIAITGSNGKTTTTSLVAHIFNESGYPAYACGNIGTPALSVMRDHPNAYYVVECSSFQLASVSQFAPHLAAILNITPDHLEWHGSFEAYANAKLRIAEHQTKEDWLLLNPGDAVSRKAYEEGRFSSVVEWIQKDSVDAKQLRSHENWKLFGEHNVENALFAIDIARQWNLREDQIRHALSTFRPIEHRMEHIASIGGVDYINDSKATNVDSTVRALEALHQPILLIAGGYDKNVPFDELYRAAQGHVRKMILIGETREKLAQGAKEVGLGDRLVLTETLADAIRIAHQEARRGEIVLLSPASASWDQYPNFETRGDEFRKIVLRIKDEEENREK